MIRTINKLYVPIAGLFLGLLVATQSPEAMAQASPQWKVGDSWQVGSWLSQVHRPEDQARQGFAKPRGQGVTVTFEVTAINVLDRQKCFELDVAFPPETTGFQRHYIAYYTKDGGKLLRIRDLSQRTDGSTKDLTTDLTTQGQGPVVADDVAGVLPLAWPDLTKENVAPITAPIGAVVQSTLRAAQAADGTNAAEDEVSLMKAVDGSRVKVVQRWRSGEPWWRTSRKYENGKLVSEAVLLQVNGNQVAVMGPPDP